MDKKDLESLIEIRKELIDHFDRLRDYKTNKNALMKESDHAARIHRTITQIDDVLKEHVSFS
jgi:hypothetical protein